MKPPMKHDEVFAALSALALDAVDPSERAGVMSHVADCEICRAELESLRATASSLAFAAPLAADTATMSRGRIRDKLTARATAEGQARRLANPPLVFFKENGPTPASAASRPSGFHRAVSPSPGKAPRHPAEWVA